jgi:hypothetical protein
VVVVVVSGDVAVRTGGVDLVVTWSDDDGNIVVVTVSWR